MNALRFLRNFKLFGLALGLIVALTIALAGCQGQSASEGKQITMNTSGSSGGDSGTGGGITSETELRLSSKGLPGSVATPAANSARLSESPSEASMDQTPLYTFGIIYPMAHPFYEEITRLTEEAASPERVRLVVKAPEVVNLEQQIHMMETMIQQKVDAIAISPIDSSALGPVIDKAVQAGIPVICFESDVPNSKRSSYIGTDNVDAGVQMGKIIKQMTKNKGMILVESGVQRMELHQRRLQGLLDYLRDETRIQVLEVRHNEGDSDKALTDLEAMIDAHPHFDALVSIDLISSSNSVLVWKAKGLNRYAAAFNMTPEMKESLRNGQITSVLSQNEESWGRLLIDHLLQAARGETVPPFTDTGKVVINSSAP
ncbi:substrate-binding domain-containing protein [Paenibacillus vini]|uniref:sugar ABC transporter substrate-binding protein n=1 Tax=Paenibacillus vini TaxID=1476024 RepID=UPI0025B68E13|nr:substrate-binding domain-containing protein [Paenibacillus vini]MDN4068687.1 substrate-binding domain-containing protein [Paenibacillus vini]